LNHVEVIVIEPILWLQISWILQYINVPSYFAWSCG